MIPNDPARSLLRHTVATLSYRASKAVTDAPPEFATFQAAPGSRTPGQILAHMGDLFDWALSMAQGRQSWSDSSPLAWGAEVQRFFAVLRAFDELLATDNPLEVPAEILFQGPVADALTHTGQLTYLRRLAGCPIRGENYAKATVITGRTDMAYDTPRFEFD